MELTGNTHFSNSASASRHHPLTRWTTVTNVTLGTATTLVGLVAGFFYAYACSVMIGLSNADDRTFIAAMQEINASIRNIWFGTGFFGAPIVSALAAAAVARCNNRRALGWTIAGLLLTIAMTIITFAISVPLNNDLAAAGPVDRTADLAAVRESYEDVWVRWNIIRTVTSTLALVAMIRAVMLFQPDRTPG